MDDDSVGSFNFIREETFHGLPEFFSVRNTFRIQIVKVLLLSVSYNFCTFIPLCFTVLQIYASARFTEFITQFRPCHDFFSWSFCDKRVIYVLDLFCL